MNSYVCMEEQNMNDRTQCPRCGGYMKPKQVKNIVTKYCNRCGPSPWGTHVKTGETMRIDGKLRLIDIEKEE
jgi:Zn-finger nucleic acid-binding protein